MIWAPFLGGTRIQQLFLPRMQRQQDEADAIFRDGQQTHERRVDQASRFNDVRFALAERWPSSGNR